MSTVAIVGTTLVAPALALALADVGQPCVLIDTTPSGRAIENDPRPIALSLSSVRILRALAVWPELSAHAQAIQHIHVSEQGRLAKLRLNADESGVDAFGYVINAGAIAVAFRDAIQARIEAGAPIEIYRGACELSYATDRLQVRIEGLASSSDGSRGDGNAAHCAMQTPLSVNTPLLVMADSAVSVLCNLPITSATRDYHQAALAFTVALGQAHAGVAYERFTPEGPLALLPLSGQRAGVVWSVNDARAAALTTLDSAALSVALQAQFGGWLGALSNASPAVSFPLSLRETVVTAADARTLLIGNAALQLHPVAGQGLNLALRDVAVLAEQLQRSGSSEELGSASFCRQFLTARAADRRLVRMGTDAAVRLYSGRGLLARLVRAPLLAGLAVVPPARHHFANVAMGLLPPQPRLVRGASW